MSRESEDEDVVVFDPEEFLNFSTDKVYAAFDKSDNDITDTLNTLAWLTENGYEENDSIDDYTVYVKVTE